MFDAFSTIAYALAAGSIGFALVLALTSPGRRRDQIVFFSIALLALLVHVLGQLLVISGIYRYAPHLVGADLSIKMALGPAVYFYTRALISAQKPGFGGLDWLAFLGPVLVILVSLPFAGLSAVRNSPSWIRPREIRTITGSRFSPAPHRSFCLSHSRRPILLQP